MMDFKKEYKDLLDQAGSPGKLAELSFLHYTKNYANAQASDRINEVIPGKIYTFFYEGKPGEGSYINHRPILFVQEKKIQKEKQVISGVDLMLVPPRDRLNFFIRLFVVYGKIINQNEKKKEVGMFKSQAPLVCNTDLLETLFGGIKYKHSYKGYKLEKIKRFKEIPIEEWKHVVYLNNKSLEGATLEEIYNSAK
jgi:hypothetical protein